LPLVEKTGIVSVKSSGSELVSKDKQFTKSHWWPDKPDPFFR
jgi:hypothetical protein